MSSKSIEKSAEDILCQSVNMSIQHVLNEMPPVQDMTSKSTEIPAQDMQSELPKTTVENLPSKYMKMSSVDISSEMSDHDVAITLLDLLVPVSHESVMTFQNDPQGITIDTAAVSILCISNVSMAMSIRDVSTESLAKGVSNKSFVTLIKGVSGLSAGMSPHQDLSLVSSFKSVSNEPEKVQNVSTDATVMCSHGVSSK
jgi:hypothetical protein